MHPAVALQFYTDTEITVYIAIDKVERITSTATAIASVHMAIQKMRLSVPESVRVPQALLTSDQVDGELTYCDVQARLLDELYEIVTPAPTKQLPPAEVELALDVIRSASSEVLVRIGRYSDSPELTSTPPHEQMLGILKSSSPQVMDSYLRRCRASFGSNTFGPAHPLPYCLLPPVDEENSAHMYALYAHITQTSLGPSISTFFPRLGAQIGQDVTMREHSNILRINFELTSVQTLATALAVFPCSNNSINPLHPTGSSVMAGAFSRNVEHARAQLKCGAEIVPAIGLLEAPTISKRNSLPSSSSMDTVDANVELDIEAEFIASLAGVDLLHKHTTIGAVHDALQHAAAMRSYHATALRKLVDAALVKHGADHSLKDVFDECGRWLLLKRERDDSSDSEEETPKRRTGVDKMLRFVTNERARHLNHVLNLARATRVPTTDHEFASELRKPDFGELYVALCEAFGGEVTREQCKNIFKKLAAVSAGDASRPRFLEAAKLILREVSVYDVFVLNNVDAFTAPPLSKLKVGTVEASEVSVQDFIDSHNSWLVHFYSTDGRVRLELFRK